MPPRPNPGRTAPQWWKFQSDPGKSTLMGQIWLVVLMGAAGYVSYDGWTLSDPLKLSVFLSIALSLLFVAMKPTWAAAGIAFTASVCLLSYFMMARANETNALRPIALEARRAAESQPKTGGPATLAGKALVWDLHADRLSRAHYRLPYPLRARPNDPAMTVFVIWDVRSAQVGTLRNLPQNARTDKFTINAPIYRDTADIAVVRWPERRMVAWLPFVGAAPPTRMTLQREQATAPVHGDLVNPLAQWIRSMDNGASLPNQREAATFLPSRLSPNAAPTRPWTEAEARSEAVRRYPQLSVANSPMNRAFLARYQQVKATNPSYLLDLAWPLRLAEEVAR
jgi:hypothetical protein